MSDNILKENISGRRGGGGLQLHVQHSTNIYMYCTGYSMSCLHSGKKMFSILFYVISDDPFIYLREVTSEVGGRGGGG